MADIAQKLEQAEMAMGSSVVANNDDALFFQLAADTVHYTPSGISTCVDNILSELNGPPPPPVSSPPLVLSLPLNAPAPLDQQKRHPEALPSDAA
ncbi:DELLA protein SLN1-like [Zingiber officinale]|uniref:DELLA protein SLN1-like n=1 Tax=Zingiber officinale TaxID=94328 RepID=UPI001C4D728A|nr:DELLA protein SLN1-like [Zingiber officinale]